MPERCGHCGFAGDLDEVARPVVRTQRSMTDLYGEIEARIYWFLYRCGRCGKATLEEDHWCDEFSDPEDETAVQLFPASQDNSAIPDAVKRPCWEAKPHKGRCARPIRSRNAEDDRGDLQGQGRARLAKAHARSAR